MASAGKGGRVGGGRVTGVKFVTFLRILLFSNNRSAVPFFWMWGVSGGLKIGHFLWS